LVMICISLTVSHGLHGSSLLMGFLTDRFHP